MSGLISEIGRKVFHMLSLLYWAAYRVLGYPRILSWMIPWTAFVVIAETARLRSPKLNRFLMKPFGSMARAEEAKRYSGIFHTTVGAFLLFWALGGYDRIVTAALFYVALGDTAAALVGKSAGRHKIAGTKKSWEGSLACLATCLVCGLVLGFKTRPAFLSALVAAVIEACPTSAYFNDNMWMPLAAGLALKFL